MEPKTGQKGPVAAIESAILVNAEIYGNEMAGYLLSGTCESALTVVPQKLHSGLIRTTYPERTAIQMQSGQPIEPLTCAGRIKSFDTLEYIGKNVFNFMGSHTTVLCESLSYARTNCPPGHLYQMIFTLCRTNQA